MYIFIGYENNPYVLKNLKKIWTTATPSELDTR